jgi:uncharacterized YccA/Bax inhibitor family protein
MRTSNPTLKERYFTENPALAGSQAMTVQGTATKSIVLVLLTIFAASFTWREYMAGNTGIVMPALLVGALGGLVIAFVTAFKPNLSPYTAPLYGVLEGIFLGAVSAYYAVSSADPVTGAGGNTMVIQAVGLTFMVFLAMLLIYRTGIIQVTDKFRMGVVGATAGIMLFYLVMFLLSMFGVAVPGVSAVFGSGWIGIGFSLVVITIAALNLVLDFDLIENGVRSRAAKYMEWYGAFALLVTLVWLYLEILRLLSKLNRR